LENHPLLRSSPFTSPDPTIMRSLRNFAFCLDNKRQTAFCGLPVQPTRLFSFFHDCSRINWPRSRRVGYLESNAVSPEAFGSEASRRC